jgi:hypothetical protein
MDTTITRISPLVTRHSFTIDGPIPIAVSIDHLDHDEFRRLGFDLDPSDA